MGTVAFMQARTDDELARLADGYEAAERADYRLTREQIAAAMRATIGCGKADLRPGEEQWIQRHASRARDRTCVRHQASRMAQARQSAAASTVRVRGVPLV